ncbi:hypothetical protein QIH87_35220 [Bradyrhizobium elkanii]|uniref:hypothetical protein n=1 Tax=Bradyrhizobium elkanii TaxID=29448 RepID=UPI00271550B4|nr:hypothetical protein [Bradyrhizobium elkanii]WLB07300.1 hypothetical protein QIH87_35220 [Bradyrhizobium elkanii]
MRIELSYGTNIAIDKLRSARQVFLWNEPINPSGTKDYFHVLPGRLSDRGRLEFRGIVPSGLDSITKLSGAAPAQRLAARRRALWPAFCALICTLLVLIGFDHLQDELGLSAKANLMMLSASFFSGWFLGVIAGMDQD